MGEFEIAMGFIMYVVIGGGLILFPIFSFLMRDKLSWFPGKRIFHIQVFNFKKDLEETRLNEIMNNPDCLDVFNDLYLVAERKVWKAYSKKVPCLWFETIFIFGIPFDYHLQAFLISEDGKPTIRLLQLVPGVWQEHNLKPIDVPKGNVEKLSWLNYVGQVTAANREAIDATNEEIAKDQKRDLLIELGIPAMAMIFSLMLLLLTTSYGENLNKETMAAVAKAPTTFCAGYAQQQIDALEAQRKKDGEAPNIFAPVGVLNVTG